MNQLQPINHNQTLSDVVRSFARRGDDDALCFFNGFRIFRYSYREVYDLSLRCAAYFRDKGVGRGDRVLIWASNRPEWGVVFCACALSGVVLVPLDARNTEDFAVRVGRETEAKLIVRSRVRRDPGLPIPTVFVEDLFEFLKAYDPAEITEQVKPGDPLEILYTSGTTGNPKGVVLTHGNIVANLSDILQLIPVDQSYRLLSVLPLSHALEQMAGFWAPLAAGGSVLYLQAMKPSALFQAFQRDRITVMILVPRLLALLKHRIENTLQEKHLTGYLKLGLSLSPLMPVWLRKIYFYPIHKGFNPKFNLFVVGGSSLPHDVEQFWRAIGFELLQGYGLTETSPVLAASGIGGARMGSVGHALSSVKLRMGGDGEILAQGPNVFGGYYQNQKATDEVFEDGWFKTGDIGEQDQDGFLYIKSRKKDIIVTPDGLNVYPEDIESIMDTDAAIKEACVIGIGEHQEKIHAVVQWHETVADGDAVIQRVNLQLPPEQRIESWSEWTENEFPKTTTLKIKKNLVRQKIADQGDKPDSPQPVQGTMLQQIICEIADIPLKSLYPEAKLGDDLGLSSIGRVELITRLEEEYRIDIDDDVVTPDTTVAGLDQIIIQKKGAAQDICFRRSTLSPICRAVRWAFDRMVVRNLMRIYCDVECSGLENLGGLNDGPYLIVSNHTSHIDTPLIRMTLPPHIGDRICPAAWREYFNAEGRPLHIRIGKWMAWQIATIFFNIFPFPQTAAYRKSMSYAGELVDKGWSVLFYPEGGRTIDGDWKEFREGIGILSSNLSVPIIPVAILGGEKILPAGAAIPKRNKVKIAFGRPFCVDHAHYKEIADQVKQEMRALWETL